MDCVTCRVDPTLDAQYPADRPARVEVTLADGRTLVASTPYAKGDPRNPLSQNQVIAKLRSIVKGVIDKDTDAAMLDYIRKCREETRYLQADPSSSENS